MNRLIKFNAWDDQEKVMYENVFFGKVGEMILLTGDLLEVGSETMHVKDINYASIIPLQYITSDRLQQDLHEGDIVKYAFKWTDGKDGIKDFYPKIQIMYGYLHFDTASLKYVLSPSRVHPDPRYVIMEKLGNIYQNPELVTKYALIIN